MRYLIALLTLSTLFSSTPVRAEDSPGQYVPTEGDIVFQQLAGSELLDAIGGITQSDFTHCGMVVLGADNRWKVLEAIGPVREIPLEDWIAAGREGGFAAYHLKDEHRDAIPAMIAAAREEIGKPYDIRYRFDDENIYCSELVFKAYRSATGQQLGTVRTLEALNWEPFTEFIKEIEGGPVPLQREIITPVDLAMADQLEYKYHEHIILGKRDTSEWMLESIE